MLPALRADLPRETFLDLYVTRRYGLATIAEQYGVSRQSLTRLAHEYDVTLRPASRPRRLAYQPPRSDV